MEKLDSRRKSKATFPPDKKKIKYFSVPLNEKLEHLRRLMVMGRLKWSNNQRWDRDNFMRFSFKLFLGSSHYERRERAYTCESSQTFESQTKLFFLDVGGWRSENIALESHVHHQLSLQEMEKGTWIALKPHSYLMNRSQLKCSRCRWQVESISGIFAAKLWFHHGSVCFCQTIRLKCLSTRADMPFAFVWILTQVCSKQVNTFNW